MVEEGPKRPPEGPPARISGAKEAGSWQEKGRNYIGLGRESALTVGWHCPLLAVSWYCPFMLKHKLRTEVGGPGQRQPRKVEPPLGERVPRLRTLRLKSGALSLPKSQLPPCLILTSGYHHSN